MPVSPQTLLDLLGVELPIIQAPMAGVSSPAMAAAVANAGALGSIGVGATNAAGARKMMAEIRKRSGRPFNVNVFCHQPAKSNPAVEAAWIERLRPEFTRLGGEPPAALTEIYRSLVEDYDMLTALLADKPKVVSFHFGAPPDRVRALRDAGIVLVGSVTSVDEARMLVAAGVHAVVAQGYD
jgi:nitronate monooxygenase